MRQFCYQTLKLPGGVFSLGVSLFWFQVSHVVCLLILVLLFLLQLITNWDDVVPYGYIQVGKRYHLLRLLDDLEGLSSIHPPPPVRIIVYKNWDVVC